MATTSDLSLGWRNFLYLPLPGVGIEVLGLSSAGRGSPASQHESSPLCEPHGQQEAIEEPGINHAQGWLWTARDIPPQYLPRSLPRDSLSWNQPGKAERSKVKVSMTGWDCKRRLTCRLPSYHWLSFPRETSVLQSETNLSPSEIPLINEDII